ncbi:unnamed protein product [Tilletia laevis]|uniref:Disintegrin and metalloproteinase domain-containing protein B n=2 Tax=Tilletia TaxID=13289 RepID=A0A177U9R1_9BASI|nr:hypothetical protein CF336_g4720 [Tilletia laevis]KAE8262384.1 hypothetical protein A4X03_0g2492 [Tilletia caries]KAE8201909.1 hypothetical protein CF335_g3617 [Tilletia laevis]CAD6930372.1 unnamed protein product [Tilletia caries]CAD6960383.1 unnamed protein product [Tilletia laevis]
MQCRSFSRSPASRCLLLISLLWLATAHSILASSSPPRPFKRLSHASDISIDLISRQPSERDQQQLSRRSDDTSGSTSSTRKLVFNQARDSSIPDREVYLPRKLERSEAVLPQDSLRLTFRAFGQRFHLHLEPNADLVHPDGILVNSGSASQHRISPSDVKAYHGVVVQSTHSGRRAVREAAGVKRELYHSRSIDDDSEEGVVGRAAIIVHDDGSLQGRSPSFEGTFDWNDNVHFISTASTYAAVRSPLDPILTRSRRDLEEDSIIIHRMSDMVNEDEEAELRSVRRTETRQSGLNPAGAGCSADSHDFNVNNPLFLTEKNNDEFSRSPLSFFVAKTASPSSLFSRSLFTDLLPLADRRRAVDVEGEPLEARDSSTRFSYEAPIRRQSGNDIAGSGANTSYISEIGSTTGCPASARVVYIGLAADCSYSGRFGGDENAVRRRLLTNMNSVSALYRSTFNVSLGVTALEVRSASCPSTPSSSEEWNAPCSNSFTLDERLSAFSRWRGTQDGSTGLWHLLTACATGTEVGVAWLGTVCRTGVSSSSSDSVSGTGVTASTTIESQIIAHEIGHNFGAVHDCTTSCSLTSNSARQGAQFGGATCCPRSTSSCDAGGGFVMNPSSSGSATAFSPCSIGNICSLLGRGLNTSCVVAPGQRATLSTQQCGNGILEPGEECDAGPNGSRCCTSQCRFASGAVCDPTSSACCSSSCSFSSNSTVCRPAVDGRCDVAETCSGTSAECPTDVTKPDGESCASGLQCARGVCTSRDQQCQQAGSSLGLSQACSTSFDTGCSIACRDPDNFASCLVLQQTFIDGTPCRWGGRCDNGDCRRGSWQDVFKGWFRDNQRISIPVTIVVGLLILLLLWSILKCIFNRCFRRGHNRTAPSTSYQQGRIRSGGSSRPPSGWVDPSAWNGTNGNMNGHNGYAASNPYQGPQMGYAPPPGPPPPPARH